MSEAAMGAPVLVGDAAPSFSLPAIHREGRIGLDDYRGSSALLLGMLRGIYCSFCRRQMAQLGEIVGTLQELGVETLVVITTPVERARLYSEFYPTALPLASDTEMTVHRAYGLPRPAVTNAATQWPVTVNPEDIERVWVSTGGELPEPITLGEAVRRFERKDGFEKSEADVRELDATWTQMSGLVLMDKAGIVRWVDIEAPGSFSDYGHIASNAEILAAARGLAG